MKNKGLKTTYLSYNDLHVIELNRELIIHLLVKQSLTVLTKIVSIESLHSRRRMTTADAVIEDGEFGGRRARRRAGRGEELVLVIFVLPVGSIGAQGAAAVVTPAAASVVGLAASGVGGR